MKNTRTLVLLLALLVLAASFGHHQSNAQKNARKQLQSKPSIADSDWPAYGRDAGGSRYSPLTQINRNNVKNLKVAWTYRTGDPRSTLSPAKSDGFTIQRLISSVVITISSTRAGFRPGSTRSGKTARLAAAES
jgi:glucose dehydrogenase